MFLDHAYIQVLAQQFRASWTFVTVTSWIDVGGICMLLHKMQLAQNMKGQIPTFLMKKQSV